MSKPTYDELKTRIKALEKADAERKQVEEALRESENKYRTLTDNIPVGIFRSTPGPMGRIIEVNRALVNILGYKTKEEIFSKDVAQFYENPKDRLKYSEKVALEEFVQNQELHLKKKDGTPIIVSETAIAVKDENGKTLYFDGILEDITESKRAEEELLLQKTYLEQLFNSAPEAIVLHDNNDIVVKVNDEFTKMFGYSREEAIGKPINDLVASKEYQDDAAKNSYSVIHGQRIEVDSKRKRKDGTLFDVWILGAPIIHGGKQMGVYAIYRDITERKKAEEARIRSREEARMARDIQINLLPKSNPEIPGYDIAGKSIPALNVGGDYYDFIRVDDYRLALGLGDVSGKGLAASLVMANLQATIRGQTLFNAKAKGCLERANKLLFHSTDSRTFVSLFYGILDTKNNILHYANAGQNTPFIFSTGKTPVLLNTHGPALGMQENVSYPEEKIFINPGDRLLIYSDGITEAMNERMEEFGDEKLQEIVQKNREDSARMLIDKIIDATNLHFGEASQNDDITIIILERKF